MNRRLAIIASSLIVIMTVSLWLLLRPATTTTVPIQPSLSPTATPLVLTDEDRQALDRLARELATKFLSYDKPDSQSYFDSFRPYVTDEFLKRTEQENRRYSGRLGGVSPVTSTVNSVEIELIGADSVKSKVLVTTVQKKDGKRYQQTAHILWRKQDNRWTATSILTNESTQNEAKYEED